MVEKIGDNIYLTPEEQVLAGEWKESFTCEEAREIGAHLMGKYQEVQSEVDNINRNICPDSSVLDEHNARFMPAGDPFRWYALGQDLLNICPPETVE